MAITTGNKPVEIAVDRSRGRMLIRWRDGHASTYSLEYLRSRCPCARCAHAAARQPAPPPDPSVLPMAPSGVGEKALGIRQVRVVGRYAVQIEWEDGHDTGIYSFDLLRALCQCSECNPSGKS